MIPYHEGGLKGRINVEKGVLIPCIIGCSNTEGLIPCIGGLMP